MLYYYFKFHIMIDGRYSSFTSLLHLDVITNCYLSPGGENSQGQTNQQQQGVTSINFSGLPPNINIQNITGLSGINIANLQGLQNMQMSITGGNIAVPVPISLVNSNAGVLQNQGGIFVSSLPGLISMATTAASSNTSTTLSQISQVYSNF